MNDFLEAIRRAWLAGMDWEEMRDAIDMVETEVEAAEDEARLDGGDDNAS